MAKKIYAVRKGRSTGLFNSWDDCKAAVHGFPGAVYKSFETLQEANEYLGANAASREVTDQSENLHLPENYAFTDGSYNAKTKVYGYGGFLVYGNERVVLQGSDDDPEMASMRNVAGETSGCVAAVKKAIALGLDEVTIYYDYSGIEQWATGGWKAGKAGTISYKEFFENIKDKIKVHFVKVKGHAGIEGNEEADRLAKEAVGI